MQKEKYERAKIEVLVFKDGDVIMTSEAQDYEGWNPYASGGGGGGGYEGWNPY